MSGWKRLALVGALVTGTQALAEVRDPGAYLAARIAAGVHDYQSGLDYFDRAIAADPDNVRLVDSAIAARVGVGRVRDAVPLAHDLVEKGIDSPIATMVLQADAVLDGRWQDVFLALEAGRTVSPLIDGLVRAWAYLGQGDMDAAVSAFDEVIEQPGLRPFGQYHKALALAAVGDLEGADALLDLEANEGLARTRRATIAHALVLARLGRPDAAVARLDAVFPDATDVVISDLRARMAAGAELPESLVGDAVEGVAEVYFTVGSVLTEDADPAVTLIYSRVAETLDPGHVEATLLSAALLDRLERFELAAASYARVSADDPSFPTAEMGRADVLVRSGRTGEAIAVLEALAETHPALGLVHGALGDVLRQADDYAGAEEAYTRALTLIPQDAFRRASLLFARGASRYSLGDGAGAEADMRAALELRPDNPSILNYLGYSMVEEGRNLDEAMELIEKAVALRPDSGAIVDSLGWAYFQLGRFEEAVSYLERAAELLPVDPVINDHLGDGYWAVGRQREARFQWQRALSFDPEEDEAARIRAKLERGLDAVLAEEGAPPLTPAQDG